MKGNIAAYEEEDLNGKTPDYKYTTHIYTKTKQTSTTTRQQGQIAHPEVTRQMS